MQIQECGKIVCKRLCDIGIAVGNVGDKVNQIAQRNDAVVVGRGWRLHEELQEGLILAVLVAEIISVRSAQCNQYQVIEWVEALANGGLTQDHVESCTASSVCQKHLVLVPEYHHCRLDREGTWNPQIRFDLLERSNLALAHDVRELITT